MEEGVRLWLAGLACAMIKGLPFNEALRLASAAGTATAAMDGSEAAGLAPARESLPQVIFEELS